MMLKLKELIHPSKESAATPSDLSATAHGVRLPKLDVLVHTVKLKPIIKAQISGKLVTMWYK